MIFLKSDESSDPSYRTAYRSWSQLPACVAGWVQPPVQAPYSTSARAKLGPMEPHLGLQPDAHSKRRNGAARSREESRAWVAGAQVPCLSVGHGCHLHTCSLRMCPDAFALR